MIELPEKSVDPSIATFEVPHILISAEGRTKTVREGGLAQVQFEIENTYSFEKPEQEPLFKIEAPRQILFGGLRLSVLTDGLEGVSPSSPTASEYLTLVGTKVMTGFRISIDRGLTDKNGAPVYRTSRVYLPLP